MFIKLKAALERVVQKLVNCGWFPNYDQSELKPLKNIDFLGADWSSKEVTRSLVVERKLELFINAINTVRDDREVQIVRGFRNYYL